MADGSQSAELAGGRERAASGVPPVAGDVEPSLPVRLERQLAAHGALVVAVLTPLLLLEQWSTFGPDAGAWDWPAVTAGVTLALALPFALRVAAEGLTLVPRLVQRRVLAAGADALQRDVLAASDRWARWAGPTTALALLGVFVGVWGVGWRLPLVLFGGAAGLVVGRTVGRLVATSTIGRRIASEGLTVAVQPGHPDGAGGLRVVGDHYFRQAMVLAIPALWLAVRLSLPVFPLGPWRSVYVVMLAVVLALELVAFALPMRAIHLRMRRARGELQAELDRLGAEAAALLAELATCDDDAERRSLEDRVRVRRERCEAIVSLPTWPVAADVRRRFALRNVLLATPGLLNAVGIALPGDDLVKRIAEFIDAA